MHYDPEQITFFAKTDARGQQVPFGIKAKDRTKHVYVIGKTGMGKSTLLENMAVQDIKNGNGLAFIDPHGATAQTLLEYIPEDRVKDVLYFAPFDTAHPISFNVMEDVGPDKRHLVVSGLMSVFKKIWVDAWSARMEYILSNTLLALLEYPNSTLLGVNRMLSDKHYRKKVVDNISDPAVKAFWVDEFANYSERYMQEAGDAIKNKIGQFTSNPLIRNIVGQPHSSFDIRQLMDERKIIIANLSKGLVGESNANLLGSMLTTRIYLAAMSRADLSPERLKEMPNFYFYVDEFQSFANATFADILSEARKYKLNLTIAHQYIEQMEEEVRNAVFGNVGTIIAFRVGPFDAEVLETIFTPKFLAADIVNLGFAQIYLSLMIDGIGSPPFSAVTLPPIAPPHISFKDMAIAQSRINFSRLREEVEQTINAWHAESHADIAGNAGKERNNNDKVGKTNSDRNKNDRGSNNGGKKEGQPRPEIREKNNNTGGNNERRQPREQERNRTELEKSKNERLVENNRQLDNSRKLEEKPKSESDDSSREKNVEELRSVLRSIVKTETDAKETPSATKPLPEKEVKASNDSRDDLKKALAAAIGGSLAENRATQVNDTVVASSAKEEVAEKKELPTEGGSATSSASKPETLLPLNTYAAVKNRDNALDPKKLERMMRTTGNDRSPLR